MNAVRRCCQFATCERSEERCSELSRETLGVGLAGRSVQTSKLAKLKPKQLVESLLRMELFKGFL